MKKVLLIDDERFPTQYYLDYLQNTGTFEVEWVQDVDDALARFEKPFDAVVLDMMIPPGRTLGGGESKEGMISGLAILQRLRAGQCRHPVLIMTNNKTEAVQDFCRGLEPVRVLQKLECSPAKLRDELDDLLSPVSSTLT